ncbi:MAG: M16 family metallopeptidase, partial [Candidatus Zixiibacteriota bacterium]
MKTPRHVPDFPAHTKGTDPRYRVFLMTFAVCVILACVFTGRHAAAVPRISESPVHDTTFENGLSTLLMEDRSAPLIALRIVYHVGARDEVEGKTGLAQVAGRLLTQGSLGYRKEEYGRLIHSGGGDFGFQITQDNSSFWARFPKGMLRQVLLLEADRMENPLVTREKLESAKSATLRARAAYLETNIYASLVTELLSRVYAGHPYGRFQLGSEEDIVGLGVDDVRDWLDRLVQPANATLILVGDFKRDDLLQELVEIFADIPSAARPQRDLPQMAATQSEQRSHIEGSIQIPVFIGGYEVPNMSHPDRLPLDLLASLLFGERSSRLYQSLVVRSGKCMYASGDIAEYKGPCFLYYYAFMNQGEPFADAEALLQQELQSVIG